MKRGKRTVKYANRLLVTSRRPAFRRLGLGTWSCSGFWSLVFGVLLARTPLALSAAEPAASARKTNAFFAFCIDTHDSKKRNLEQQAALLKELGYDGVGHLWLNNIPERLKTLDAAGLKLFQITMTVDITPGKQAYDPRFKEVMPLLKGRSVQFL